MTRRSHDLIARYPYMRMAIMTGYIVRMTKVYSAKAPSGRLSRWAYAVFDCGPVFPDTKDPMMEQRRHFIRLRFNDSLADAFVHWANEFRQAGKWPIWATVVGDIERVRRKGCITTSQEIRRPRYEIQVSVKNWSQPHSSMNKLQTDTYDELVQQIELD